ncbi:MAG TPA: MarR family winged helix-turn-helix transcriptional regulator [Solirubrobacteraceae bacterium]|nr:MarR family winged helix-turn-helix transcriptional regulator [Solirubrobacteraceae bacterium]
MAAPTAAEAAPAGAQAAPAEAKTAPATRKAAPEAGVQRSERLEELGLAFRRVFRTLNRLRGRDTHLGGSEISHAQFELLIELQERGELPAGELAAAARLAPGTVTQMLDHLAACGHVERVRSKTDRRVVVSRLTPQGERKIEAKRAAWKERWDEALEGVGPRDLLAATRVLERLAEMLEDAPPAAACDHPEEA